MLTLSGKIRSIEESQTLVLTAKTKRMRDAGIDVISLTAGEPDFPTPSHVKEAGIRAIESNFTKYTQNVGSPDLIDAIIRKFSHDNDLHFGQNQIVVSTGAKQSIYNVLQAICDKGDEILFFAPYWVSYPEMVKLADALPVVVPTFEADNFRPDIDALRRSITPKTKALILNSPNNPSGAVFTREELESIAQIVKEANIFVISDEIYEKVIYDGAMHFSIGSIRAIRDNVITVNGVSKAYAMTGWRIGYAGGPHHVMEAAAKVQTQVTSNANSIAQKAAAAALAGPTAEIRAMVEEFRRRRDYVFSRLSAIEGVSVSRPLGAFYFLFDVHRVFGKKFQKHVVRDSTDLAGFLLEQHHVGAVPGSAFGNDASLRISYACSMIELEKGLDRISAGLESLS